MIIEREKLEGQLRTSIMEVTFNKISGDERVMTCTLNVSHLPPATKKDPMTQEKIRKINEEVGVERVEVILPVITHINLYDTKDQRNNQRQILDC
jgi:hypothetical protein